VYKQKYLFKSGDIENGFKNNGSSLVLRGELFIFLAAAVFV